MDKNWSEMNKEMQALLSKEATFRDAVGKLIQLRDSLFEQITHIVNAYPEEAFRQISVYILSNSAFNQSIREFNHSFTDCTSL
jgi:hypothetical protein